MKNRFRRSSYEMLALCAGVFVLALLVRAWTNTWLADFWGDSYHHWLITRLTMLNGGVYTDYKGLETVWSPLYHYVSMIPLGLTGSSNIAALHWMNTLFGALACALSAYLAWRLCENRIAAFASGAVLAVMTWHIAFSGMNVAEVFSGVLVLGVVLVLIREPRSGAQRHASNVKSHGLPTTDYRSLFNAHYLLFFLALAMSLTRTDLIVYLAILVLWLWISRRYGEALVVMGGVAFGLGGWSLWSFYKTGNFLHWYEQYAENNLHDWLAVNPTGSAGFAFASYLNRLSPFVLPALWAGMLGALGRSGARRRGTWLVTALLGGHSLFLILGYARGLVPLLTERYLVIDLPLVAVLMGAWGEIVNHKSKIINAVVALALILTTFLRFQNDIPELQIRRWGIDQEWQIGNFLYAQVQPGDIVLTDAPVAIYRSGKPLNQFVSSVALGQGGDTASALKQHKVRWIVTQPALYDAASRFVPRQLMAAQTSGHAQGLYFDLVWRYDPTKTDIQSEVWHVIEIGDSLARFNPHLN